MSTERTIEELTRRWLKAAASNDVEAVMALYHPAIRSFDAILALQVEGAPAYREHWKKCMASCPADPFSRCMTSKWKRPIPWRSVTA